MNFSQLEDGAAINVSPSVLVDFKFGNKRRNRPSKDYDQIKASIEAQGILQNLVTRPHPEDDTKLELLAGYGRKDIAIDLALVEVPVKVLMVDDREAYLIHMAENSHRTDLSTVDLAMAAQEYNTMFAGDREAVAKEINKPLKQVNELLELMKCSEKVLKAVEDGNNKFSFAHALALAPFSHKAQEKLLDIVLTQGWTVKELKLQLGSKQTPIKSAKFDTAECNACPHNTYHQMGLLDDVSTEAKCSKISCFREKTQEWVNGLKATAEERFGKVLFLSESAQKDRNTVTVEQVGEEQFTNGCSSCEKRVVIMSDAAGSEGEISESQCIDKICFGKCSATIGKATEEAMSDPTVVAIAKKDPEKAKKLAKSKAVKTSKGQEVGSMSNVAEDAHKELLRQAAAGFFANDKMLSGAMMLAATAQATGFKGNAKHKLKSGFDDLILDAYLNMDMPTMQGLMLEAISHGLKNSERMNHSSSVSLLLNLLKAKGAETAKRVAVDAWKPTEQTLKHYTTPQLIQLAKDAKLDEAMNAKEKGSFAKLTKGKKADLAQGIIEADHDYSEFAPSWYLAHVKPK